MNKSDKGDRNMTKHAIPTSPTTHSATTPELSPADGSHPDGGSENRATNTNDTAADFDLGRLRLSQDFAAHVGVKKALLSVPVRKPDRQTFVRVHPDPEWRLDTYTLQLKEERGDIYIVDRPLWAELSGEIVPTALFTAITRQNDLFLWTVRLPGEDGRHDQWSRSALDAATMAMHTWVRVVSNVRLGTYEVYQPTAFFPEPEWPTLDFPTIFGLAFRDKYIETLDHPVVRRLRGEA